MTTPDVQLAIRELEAVLHECEAESKRHYEASRRFNDPYAFGRKLEADDIANTIQAALNRLRSLQQD
jgi:hypothetical protein